MKRLIASAIFVFIIFFSCSIIAQRMLLKENEINFASKIYGSLGDPLSGTYTIGSGGNFPTIDSAFKKLSVDGITGPVTLELIDTLYTSPNGSPFILNGPIKGTGAQNRVTIKPVSNKNVTIVGNGENVIRFSNISYLTLDGVDLNGATTLTIHAMYNAKSMWNDCTDFLDNSDHNVIQNVTFISEDYKRQSASMAIWSLSNAPDSNLIQNNFIKKGAMIYISAKFSNARAKGNVIRNNIVGSTADSLIGWGILIEKTQNTVVENNIIQNLTITLTDDKNRVFTDGINSFWGVSDTIRNNIVHKISAGNGLGSFGILLSGESGKTGSNILVYNNMVYDINSNSHDNNGRAGGIQISYQDNPQIFYNSVYLNGDGNGANPDGSAALWISNNCTNVEAKNNIFINARNESPYMASSIYDLSASNLIPDNNDLFCTANQHNALVNINGTEYKTLADWQVTGKDLNSINEMPNFTGGDLHINKSIPTNIESHGIPIAGIVTDFDGEARATMLSDIGADEFSGTAIVGINDQVRQPLRFTLEQNFPNPFNPVTTIKYSIPEVSFVTLKVYDILGREVTSLINKEQQKGIYEVQFSSSGNAHGLSSGVYIYKLTAGKFAKTRKMILLQ